MSPRASIPIMVIAALALAATAAGAHPRLQVSNPAPGARLSAAPKEIRMNFSEGLELGFTGLELKDGSGKLVPTGKPSLAAGDNQKLVVPIAKRLTKGTYSVSWHAVSIDTHRVSGS